MDVFERLARRPKVIMLAALGGMFVLVGAAQLWHTIEVAAGARGVARWRELPCEIVESRLERMVQPGNRSRAVLRLAYRYEVGGVERRGSAYSLGATSPGSRAIHEAYPVGARTTCWVDPTAPERAVLVRDVDGLGLSAALGLLVAAAGAVPLGVAWFLYHGASSPKSGGGPDDRRLAA